MPLPGSDWRVWRECMLRAAGFPVEGLSRLAAPAYGAAADELARARAGGAAPPAHMGELERLVRKAADEALADEADMLRSVAADERFREAVTWQNQDVRRMAVDPFAETGPGSPRNHNFRKRSKVVAKYWHRYCAKNDTIGFFGPVCWASIVEDGDTVDVRPGPSLLRDRTVFLERWCVEAYADVMARDPEVRPWLAPHQPIHQHLDGGTVHHPPFPPTPLRPADAGVLALCDGERSAWEIARLAVADPALQLRNEADVHLALEGLVRQKVLSWDVALPMELRPERTLRRRLERIEDEAVRDRALAGLDRLEAGRAAVAAAAGDVAALDAALDALAQTFTELTGAEPSRSYGQAYAGRTLVFEDTRRDLDVRIGPGLLEAVGPAMELLLAGARWLVAETGEAYREVFRQAYADELRPGRSGVELGQLWPWVQASLFGSAGRPIDGVMAEFLRRWDRVLHLDGGAARMQLASGDLRPGVEAEFPAAPPPWPGARHHSADLQIDAVSADALNRGDYQVVLGELHAAWNTLDVTVFAAQHDDPQRLVDCMTGDLPDARVLAVVPATWPRRTGRTVAALVRDHDLQLGWTEAPPPWRGRLLRLGELVIDDVGGDLKVRTRDGRLAWDPLELIGSFLSELVVDAYKSAFAGAGDHVPRTRIDRLVVSRETWRMPVGELDFASAKDEVQRFVAARAWRLRRELPEHVFVGFAHETKPFGVDLRSPVQVEALAAAARAGMKRDGPRAPVVVSEMLPAPDGAWVPDAQGGSYVSELRLQFVAPEPFVPRR